MNLLQRVRRYLLQPRFEILPLSRDLRGGHGIMGLEQARADARTEAEWRRRVRENPKEIAALPRRQET